VTPVVPVSPAPSRNRFIIPPFDRNGWLVITGKIARTFGFGMLSIGIGLHLAAIGLDPATTGIILGCALLGTMLLTLLIAVFGDRVGRRNFLIIGSALMMGGALMPLVADAPLLMALIASTGAVSATASESSGLVSADQAILPQTVPLERRTEAFSFYSLVAYVSSAVGSAAIAPLVGIAILLGATEEQEYVGVFLAYALAGAVSAMTALRLDKNAEVAPAERIQGFGIVKSRGVVAEITALFSWDAFATGLILNGFLAYWFKTAHGMGAGEIAALYAITSIISAFSFPTAARLGIRFGLVWTMVWTNLPANLMLIALALVPPGPVGTPVVVGLFLVRSFLAAMDQPIRQSYVMAIVDPSERTATAGVTSLVRSGAQTAGPFIAGTLLLPLGVAVPVAVSGILKVGYNVVLWQRFRNRPAPEELGRRRGRHTPVPATPEAEPDAPAPLDERSAS
jgi:MFS family permease